MLLQTIKKKHFQYSTKQLGFSSCLLHLIYYIFFYCFHNPANLIIIYLCTQSGIPINTFCLSLLLIATLHNIWHLMIPLHKATVPSELHIYLNSLVNFWLPLLCIPLLMSYNCSLTTHCSVKLFWYYVASNWCNFTLYSQLKSVIVHVRKLMISLGPKSADKSPADNWCCYYSMTSMRFPSHNHSSKPYLAVPPSVVIFLHKLAEVLHICIFHALYAGSWSWLTALDTRLIFLKIIFHLKIDWKYSSLENPGDCTFCIGYTVCFTLLIWYCEYIPNISFPPFHINILHTSW